MVKKTQPAPTKAPTKAQRANAAQKPVNDGLAIERASNGFGVNLRRSGQSGYDEPERYVATDLDQLLALVREWAGTGNPVPKR
jgi:hypothetical protein